MSTVAKFFVVLNLVLAVVFLGAASTFLGYMDSNLKKYTDEKFTGPRAQHRPDLLLLTQLGQRYKLVEFKRPSHTLDRRDVSQAEQYRDDLIARLQPIDVMVLGKQFDARMLVNMPANVTLASYTHVISRARAELQWLLGELTRDAAPTDTSK